LGRTVSLRPWTSRIGSIMSIDVILMRANTHPVQGRRGTVLLNSTHSSIAVLIDLLWVPLPKINLSTLQRQNLFGDFSWKKENILECICTISMPDQLLKTFRPPEDCSMCRGLHQVDKVSKISPGQFEEIYAYTGRPVVITDAMENWTAQHVFSFQFFKGIYEESFEYSSVQLGCQFFPYETEFTQLREVFNMSDERASMRDGTQPWYIG
ncbi:hypothetical protein L9F63_024603, partial [Diploptera punctata]